MSKDPFDFSDLSDLPEDLASKLHTDTDENAREYAAVVIKGAEKGFDELNINQITAAALRMGMTVPTQQTVRGYLNAAVKLGLISKPGRLTYGPPAEAPAKPAAKSKAKAKAEEIAPDPVTTAEVPSDPPADTTNQVQEAPATDANEEDDPLASLGL